MNPSRYVLIYLPALTTGGAEISMLRLAQGLRENDVHVEFVVHRIDAEARALAADIPLAELGVSQTSKAVVALTAFLRKRRPDILLSALTHCNIAAALAVTLSGRRTRLVVTEHAPASSMQLLNPSLRYRRTLKAMPWVYRLADAVVAVSRGVRDDFAPRLSEATLQKFIVIYNPVLRGDWNERAQVPVNDPWFTEGAVPVVLSVGRLSPEKDFAGLIRAFAKVRTDAAPRLAIIGEGAERARLEGVIEKLDLKSRVRLLGQHDNPFAYMRRASVFVLNSKFEGFGNVLVEAMACGVPVISTDCPVGPREILADGRYGTLVPLNFPARLTAAIRAHLENKHPYSGAQERALHFTAERSVESYLALFESLLSNPPQSFQAER